MIDDNIFPPLLVSKTKTAHWILICAMVIPLRIKLCCVSCWEICENQRSRCRARHSCICPTGGWRKGPRPQRQSGGNVVADPYCNNVTVASNRQCGQKVHQFSQTHECFCISWFNLVNCFLNANYHFAWYVSNPNSIVSPFVLCFYYLLKVGLLSLVLIICWLQKCVSFL